MTTYRVLIRRPWAAPGGAYIYDKTVVADTAGSAVTTCLPDLHGGPPVLRLDGDWTGRNDEYPRPTFIVEHGTARTLADYWKNKVAALRYTLRR